MTPDTAAARRLVVSEGTYLGVAWKRLRRNTLGKAGLGIVGFLILVATIGPYLSPYDPIDSSLTFRLRPPSWAHPFGTDYLGRDELSRVLHGSRISLQVGIIAVAIGSVSGTLLGLVAGYSGGWVGAVVMRTMDIMLAFPSTLLAIGIVAARGPGLTNTMIAVGIVQIPIYARLVQGSVLSVKEHDYVLAARSAGVGDSRLMFRHILPNCLSPVIVQSTLGFAISVIQAASLGFLGLGAQPPQPEWGAMLADGYKYLETAAWALWFPGIAIMLTVLGFNLLGDGLRDALDPRLRG